MIAKITHGSSIYGAVLYNQKKVATGDAKVINSHNIIIPRAEDWNILFRKTLMSFEPYLLANKRTKKTVMHVSLNPSPEDVLDEYKLAVISDDYMRQLGYGNQPYIVYMHTDIDRKHLHIVSVNIDSDGVKIDDSYQKIRSVNICRELEIKYRLKQVTDEKKEEAGLFLKKVDYERGDIKRQVSNTLKYLTSNYHFQSFGEYNTLLSVFNIQMKHVRGEDGGNFFNGIVYQATKDDGTLLGNPIKSSRFVKTVGYDAILEKMERTTRRIKEKKVNIRRSKGIIFDAMQNSRNRNQFESVLKAYNIDVVFRENEEDRIYGVTFIDHNNKIVYNGSRLGKEFSANMFDRKFKDNRPFFPENREISVKQGQQDNNPHISLFVDEIFGTFYLDNSSYDPEEEDFQRKLRRKIKQKRKP